VPTFSRTVRLPDRGRVVTQDVLEVAVALHAARRELRDVEIARPLVTVLDQQPRPIAAAASAGVPAAGPDQHPRTLQFVSIERELQVPLLERRTHIVGLGRPRAAVPEHDDASAVTLG